MKKYFSLFILSLLISHLYAMDLLDINGVNFKLGLDYEQQLLYAINEADLDLRAPEAEMEMQANNGQLTLNVTTALPLELKDCYLSYKIIDTMLIIAGQFKNPFGAEMNLGKGSRPYPGHAIVSKAVAPGYSRGVALELTNISGSMQLSAGLFSGDDVNGKGSSLWQLMPAGNFTMDIPLGDKLTMELGYSGLVNLDFTSYFEYQLAQGFALRMDFNLGKKNDITLFGELLEKYYNAAWVNVNPHWTYGVFAFASWQLKQWEPYAAFEHFIGSTIAQSTDDTMALSGGVNFYPVGDLVLSLHYRWEYLYLTGGNTHEASFMLGYKI